MSRALHGKLVLRDGVYYFVHSESMFDRPEMVTSYWRCWRGAIGETPYDGVEAWLYSNDFGMSVSWRMGENAGWTREHSVGPKCPAEMTETAPIPCPKVRKGIETRYRNGKWERCLKTGWTAV